MAAFSSLTDRLSNAFKHLKSKGKLSEADIDGTIREIRRALLDADVALDVVRSFTSRIRERALGTEVSEALNPAQQVVKIVNEELTAVLGAGVDRPLNFAKNPPTIIMLAGLQGAGKTTLAGKLGYWLKDSGHTPLLVAADLQLIELEEKDDKEQHPHHKHQDEAAALNHPVGAPDLFAFSVTLRHWFSSLCQARSKKSPSYSLHHFYI